jgi:ribosomal protein S18 acetylase RimI-like enzyme
LDRIWSAYAIADLDPSLKAHSTWFAYQDAVVLTFRGFKPPVLFSIGPPDDLVFLFDQVPLGDYIFTLRPPSRDLLKERLKTTFETEMWRMSLEPGEFKPVTDEGVSQLSPGDLDEMVNLFADHPDRPDAFAPTQLDEGVYFGVWEDNELVSVAGTHVLSKEQSVAAVGNVFTRPDHRNKGYGTRVNACVAGALVNIGITTIVLNVSTANQPAIRSYTRIGFKPYCKYQEGLGTLTVTSRP